jgi:hypothetical protein
VGVRKAGAGLGRDLGEVSKDVGSAIGKFVFAIIFVAVLLTIPHLIWPKIDVNTLSVQTDQSYGHLSLVQIELQNGSYLDYKDPVFECEMRGPSGTAIKTVSKVVYEVLPSESKRSFSVTDMGEIPEQATQFNCYLKSVSWKW